MPHYFFALCVIKAVLLRQLNTIRVENFNSKKSLLCQILPAECWSQFWLAVAPDSVCSLSGCTADPVFARNAADKRAPRKQWQRSKEISIWPQEVSILVTEEITDIYQQVLPVQGHLSYTANKFKPSFDLWGKCHTGKNDINTIYVICLRT